MKPGLTDVVSSSAPAPSSPFGDLVEAICIASHQAPPPAPKFSFIQTSQATFRPALLREFPLREVKVSYAYHNIDALPGKPVASKRGCGLLHYSPGQSPLQTPPFTLNRWCRRSMQYVSRPLHHEPHPPNRIQRQVSLATE